MGILRFRSARRICSSLRKTTSIAPPGAPLLAAFLACTLIESPHLLFGGDFLVSSSSPSSSPLSHQNPRRTPPGREGRSLRSPAFRARGRIRTPRGEPKNSLPWPPVLAEFSLNGDSRCDDAAPEFVRAADEASEEVLRPRQDTI
ncbi:hypothetical protein L596_014486 [Steinernema carpocapsae]|uniref:Uncharacterized protein n=1 Tax=Steinernema carpocapsae TaxID=34508 RepID=A0A4U5NC41_STECR|nr:hypothetical protein L596_014486 [Steinernema carpocapsae]